MISFHLNTSDFQFHHIYCYFREADDKGNPDFIGRVITKCVNSPIVWNNGRRRSKDFQYADWLVLDFDDGLPLEEALELFKNYTHVIGTTKSHKKPKGKDNKICDRYRVWLKLSRRCENLDDYTYTIKKLAVKYGADCQAIDGARKFLPCREIISVHKGSLLEIEKKVDYKPVRQFRDDSLPHRFVPSFIRQMLDVGVAEGSRNYACYTVSKYLSKNGYSEDEIFDLIMNSPIPAGSASPREVRSAVRNGLRA